MSEKTVEQTITSYKGFDKDFVCNPSSGVRTQYAVGQTLELDGEVKACHRGFHACEYPLDVFTYYAPAGSRFAVVEQSGDISRKGDDSKVASRKISIKTEIGIAGLVKAAIDYTISRCEPVKPDTPAFSTGNRGAASSTGYRGAASSTGYYGAASSTGDYGAASSTGNRGVASSTGYQGAASSTGDYGAASSTGNRGAASSTGQHAVAMACGYEGRAMAGDTGAIVLVHRNADGEILHIRASKVGDNGIKAGVWYVLDANGEFAEAPVLED